MQVLTQKSDFTESTLPLPTVCSNFNVYKYESLFGEAMNCFIMKTAGYMAICNGIILKIIGMLYNEYTADISVFKKIKKIEKAMEYMTEKFADKKLTITDLSLKVNISEKNFRRLFFDIYKKLPMHFCRNFELKSQKHCLNIQIKAFRTLPFNAVFAMCTV